MYIDSAFARIFNPDSTGLKEDNLLKINININIKMPHVASAYNLRALLVSGLSYASLRAGGFTMERSFNRLPSISFLCFGAFSSARFAMSANLGTKLTV